MAAELDAAYAPLREMFSSACAAVCPDCPSPCCARVDVKGLLDQADLVLFAAMLTEKLADPAPVSKGCAFLGQAGCRLPWKTRPFACLHHLCRRLQAAMAPAEQEMARAALRQAAHLRGRLLAAFLEGRGLHAAS